MRWLFLLLCCLVPRSIPAATPPETVRVAALQFPSAMGETAANLKTIDRLVRQAAAKGAKIVVLPECSVQGYFDPTTWTGWAKQPGPEERDVGAVAEPVPGPATKQLATLADDLDIYLAVGLIEADGDDFFNSLVLLDPQGDLIAHHRKKSLWPLGDSAWCTKGDRPVQAVDTPYGRLGLMICYDFHTVPPLLAEKGVDLVLYAVGWYGPNEKNWFGKVFPRKAVVPHGFDIVVANWSSASDAARWPGRGHSCIITGAGKVLKMAVSVTGSEIVIADLKVRPRRDEDKQ